MTGTGTAVRASAVTSRLEALPVAALDQSGVRSALRDVRTARGFLDAIEAQLMRRADVLHETANGAPATDTAASCGGTSAGEARKRSRRSKTLEKTPSFESALAGGSVTAEHVDALASATSQLDDDVAASVFDLEAELLADAERLSPDQFGRSVRDLARHLERDAGIERNQRQRRDTYLTRKLDAATGMIKGSFALHPELAERVFNPIDRRVRAMVAEGERSNDPEFTGRRVDRGRLAAEALGDLIERSTGDDRQSVADVTVIISHDHLTGVESPAGPCETGQGAPIPASSVRRLLCNGSITPVIVDTNGVVLNAGRTIRHANRTQRRALRSMYRTCAIETCDVAFERCEIHHITEWEQGGRTDLSNLVPLCSHHHHAAHDLGWRLELDGQRSLIVTQRTGTVEVHPPDLMDEQRPRRRRTAA